MNRFLPWLRVLLVPCAAQLLMTSPGPADAPLRGDDVAAAVDATVQKKELGQQTLEWPACRK